MNRFIRSGILLLLLLVYSCDGVKDLIDPYDAPVILNITKSRPQVAPGDTVEIVVEAENPEEGLLYYDWTAPDGGRFILPADRADVQWIAPLQGGIKQIFCTVSNEEKSTDTHVDIEVLSTEKPSVSIDAPENGSRFVQYSEIPVEARAFHENGISRVWLLLNDQVSDSLGYSGSDKYRFNVYADSSLLGPVKLTVYAEAASVAIRSQTSVIIHIDGILPGKRGN